MPRPSAPSPRNGTAAPCVEEVDTSFLETLIGYNARRAALAVIDVFLERMAPYGLRPVDFSVLSLVAHNPGITSRQLCATLGILPPNLVGMVNAMEQRELLGTSKPVAVVCTYARIVRFRRCMRDDSLPFPKMS